GILYADGKTTSYVAPRLAEPRLDAPLIYGATGFQGFPAGGLAGGKASLADLDGAGQLALLVAARGVEGFYPMAADGSWENFRPFPHALSDRDAQPAQVLDVTGDGRGDRLRVEAQQVTVNVNLGREGYAPALRRARDNLLPLTTLPQAGENVRSADVLGGGTAPIIELRDGSVRCWPNLGHGRFGAPVDLPAPVLPSSVRGERVVLADLFGSGCADMVVAYTDRLAIYRNRAGNGFTQEPVFVELPAPLASIGQLRTADVAGSGCQALVFTSDEPTPRHWVCALAGDTRPWMLTEVDNGTGQLTRISYASSARYQLLDRLQGRDWVTSLASPMQVVARVEHVDQVGGVSRVVEYHYSHGYYDPEERLFRGFGLVETRNADAPFATAAQGTGDGDAVHVREWYHTGALLAAETLEDAFAREYWHGDPDAFPMPPSCFDWQGAAPDARTWREAVAALSGTVLRREVYGLDDPLAPYSVEDFNATVRLEQPRVGEHEAVFLTLARESAKSLYDRDAADPRVQHQATLEVDQWGDVTLACDVAYGRRPTIAGATGEQLKTWFSAERTEFLAAREAPDLWLAGLPGEVRHWNLPNPPKPTVRGLYYDFQALVAAVGAAIAPGGGAKLLSWDRTVYKGEGGGQTPASPPMPQALVLRQESAAFDAAELRPLFTDAEPPGGLDAFLAEQGYRWEPETALWWNPG
ncbi:MAG TPA: toxin TcdB middle/N-terminal domain-containing protein, partial [Caulobacteraceae bacterium]|nr:toxin TcdB middle/N-terminal domain-containing protein [Caulobacteraceae bacterium]